MKMLLDECLPKKLRLELDGHEVTTVPEMGWAGRKNGELLRLAESQFDVFLTSDQNLTYQQNLSNTKISVVVLKSASTRLETLKSLRPKVREAMRSIQPGQFIRISD